MYGSAMSRAVRVLWSGVLAALAGCAGLPGGVERPSASALTDTAGTRLGRALAGQLAANEGKSAIHPLSSARDAFAARVLLAQAADRSLDVQYYIWRADITGALLCEALWRAAERGVRVRLLLDDNSTRGLDEAIAALDAHPGIEVRLFNPYANRGFRLGELATDFSRLNRRMHNKSFTADNQATIVGGRNVGDEYFGAESPVAFTDLDVLAAGPVVREVSASFDAYWNSESAYPATSLIPGTEHQTPWAAVRESPAAAKYIDAVRATPLLRELLAGTLPLEWAQARVVSDDPSKVRHPPERTELHMLPRLEAAVGKPERQLDLVSPYFVPTKEGTAALAATAGRGVNVRVLTNSLAATDVAPVHAGYAKYREELLRAGVQLYELKPRLQEKSTEHPGPGGSSDASLHAKTFAVDRSRIFVGSFNFDPRSARLNTEMGVVIESAALAVRLSDTLDSALPRDAYELRLTDNRLEWIDGEARHTSEPGAGLLQRLWINFLSILPIEWLL
jgi:phosphatidylserine/phosphatidylglycerophosphate/cardiolipin synthase-like enzyme